MGKKSTKPKKELSSGHTKREHGEYVLFIGAKRALFGGILAAAVTIGGQFLVGQVYSGTKALQMIQALVPSARAVGTGAVGATATILALMLTMLSLGRRVTGELGKHFFKRIERIGLISTILLIISILLLLILSIPLEESEKLPTSWYRIVYYTLITMTAVIAALLVAIVLMLYNAMESLITVLAPKSQPQEEGGSPSKPNTSS